MRVLFLSSAFPRPGDPARAPYNGRLCEALATRHDVTVISPIPWTSWREWAPGPVRVGSLEAVRYPVFLHPPGLLRDSHAWCIDTSIRRCVGSVVARNRPDAVISYWTYPDGAVAAAIAGRLGVPVVMMVGGSDVEVLAGHAAHRRRIIRTLQRADAVVATSISLSRSIHALGIPWERITVVRRGIDHDTFKHGDRDAARRALRLSAASRVLLWVGRLETVKGPDVLIDALARIGSTAGERDWRCYIVGDGPLRSRLHAQIERTRLQDRTELLGRLPPPALARWYQAAAVVVISSRSEGLPNVLAEAKACGVRVISADVGGVRELADEGDTLVSPDDPAALARAIGAFLQQDRDAPGRSVALPERVGSWQESAAALSDVIQRAVGGLNRRSRLT